MNTHHPHGGKRWASEIFTEQVLLESARRTITLSAARRAAVLAALFAEAARLRAASLRRIKRRADWERALAIVFTPRVVAPLSGVIALALFAVAYILLGGARIGANASITGRAALSEQRYGPFGLTWSVDRPIEEWRSGTLYRGDHITAFSPITITYADGSQTVAAPGTRLRLLPDSNGLVLIGGEVASVITPSSDGAVKFYVETATGSIAVKGTSFRVRTERDSSVSEFTDEGKVGVTNDLGTVDVTTGEQVRLKASAAPKVELQVPRLIFNTYAKDRVVSNVSRVPFRARIFPRATLIVEEAHTGRTFARYLADAAGWVEGKLPMIERRQSLRFSQAADDGRVSASSQPVDVVIDRTSPVLAITQAQRDGAQFRVVGRTEVGAMVRVEGSEAEVQPDGSFVFDLSITPGTSAMTITAIDPAGNTTSIVQTLDP